MSSSHPTCQPVTHRCTPKHAFSVRGKALFAPTSPLPLPSKVMVWAGNGCSMSCSVGVKAREELQRC
eukprot:2535-Eustigmatos_ZCMA.PRE.1